MYTSLGCTGIAHLVISDGKNVLYTYAFGNRNDSDNNPIKDSEPIIEIELFASIHRIMQTGRCRESTHETAKSIVFVAMIGVAALKIKSCSDAMTINL